MEGTTVHYSHSPGVREQAAGPGAADQWVRAGARGRADDCWRVLRSEGDGVWEGGGLNEESSLGHPDVQF